MVGSAPWLLRTCASWPPEWCAAYHDAINANAAYKVAGQAWTFGPVAMVVTAEPAISIPEDTAMWLDRERGRVPPVPAGLARRGRRRLVRHRRQLRPVEGGHPA